MTNLRTQGLVDATLLHPKSSFTGKKINLKPATGRNQAGNRQADSHHRESHRPH